MIPSHPKAQDRQVVDVVIIGAGAAGLQCASALLNSEENPSILILEARDRVGGRILTATETSPDSTTTQSFQYRRDLGAAWVHGTGFSGSEESERNPMIDLLEKATPPGQTVDYHLLPVFEGNCWTRPDTVLHKADRIALFRNGQRISNDSEEVKASIQRHYKIQEEIAKYCDHLYDIGEGISTVHTALSQIRSQILGKTNGSEAASDDLTMFYAFLNENWNGISECQLQLSSISMPETAMQTDELFVDDGDYEGPHCKLKHGMEAVIEPLHTQVTDYVRLDEKVTAITRVSPRQVRIQTESGLTVDAQCCISTIPLGCLQKESASLFEPSLNKEATEAIQSIATGYYKKVFLTFDDIFWPVDKPVLGLIRSVVHADELGQYLLTYNFWAKQGVPSLEAVLCGDSGKWALHRNDNEIRDAVLRFLKDAMGIEKISKKCISCHVTRWEEDPLTLGTYSSFCLGTLERHVDTLREPFWDGELIFAGEYTESEHMGSVQAALMSGDRAAEEALRSLTKAQVQAIPTVEVTSDLSHREPTAVLATTATVATAL